MTPKRELDALFGFWVLMMSDLVLFGVVVACYAVLHGATGAGPTAAAILELPSALAQTLVLLLSSAAFGMASVELEYGQHHRVVPWLVTTLVLGGTFVGLELHELFRLVDQGAVPSVSPFLSSFWSLVPLHGLHVTLGCGWIVVTLVAIGRQGMGSRIEGGMLRLGVYWHLLDVVWIAIVSVVYLGARA